MRQLMEEKKHMELPTTPVEPSDSGPFLLQRLVVGAIRLSFTVFCFFAVNLLFLLSLCDVFNSLMYFLFISPSFLFSFVWFGSDIPLSSLTGLFRWFVIFVLAYFYLLCVAAICVYRLFLRVSGDKDSKSSWIEKKMDSANDSTTHGSRCGSDWRAKKGFPSPKPNGY